MGYRLVLALCVLVLLGGCAAFDNGNEPLEGFSQREIEGNANARLGGFTGYYSGTMVADFNNCKTVSDRANSSRPIVFDIFNDKNNKDSTIEVVFTNTLRAIGVLDKNNSTTVMTDVNGVHYVYFLNFKGEKDAADTAIDGNCDVIEKNEAGQYTDRCASYVIEMKKGDKPGS